MRVPSSTPGGMLTDSVRSRVTRPEPRAGRARIVDHLAAALADRAGAFEREEALGVTDAAVAVAVRAGLRLGAGLGAGAGAGFAGDRGRDPHLRGLAVKGVLERDLHVVAQIGAALAAAGCAARAPPMPKMPSKISEKAEPKSAPKPCAPPRHALLERGMAEAVIGGALVAVLEDVIGLVDFLELGARNPCRRDCGRDDTASRACGYAILSSPSFAVRVHAQGFVVAALGHRRHLALARPHRCAVALRVGVILSFKATKTNGPALMPRAIMLSVTVPHDPTSGCSGRFLLVVVDFGEFRVDHVVLLARRRRRPQRPARRRPAGRRPAAPCTSPRRASSKPAPACWSWPGSRRRRRP